MRLLFACEFYFPSVGGVQEVMKQLAERMVRLGHEVTVATTRLAERDFDELHGVKVVGFDIAGNAVRGMVGELDRYREFVRTFPCDALMIKAAQQWTFDALWPVLGQITCRKVFIPCGFSGLYEPSYATYFEQLPDILRQWDHLVFYAESYRDVDFARRHGIENYTILPNGASEMEFEVEPDPAFRARHGIPEDSFLLLTVGTLTGMKGHRETAEAFDLLRLPAGRHATLLLNGNEPPKPPVQAPAAAPLAAASPSPAEIAAGVESAGPVAAPGVAFPEGRPNFFARAVRVARNEGLKGVRHRTGLYVDRYVGPVLRGLHLLRRTASSLVRNGLPETLQRIHAGVYHRTNHLSVWEHVPLRWHPAHARQRSLEQWLRRASERSPHTKLARHTELSRAELVQAYIAADLFVFASNIEYSPLVLYEAAAAGTPFLTVPVGNSEEIARWTGAGVVCPAPKDDRGYTRVEPQVLADAIARLAADPGRLDQLGRTGKQRWRANFTWAVIARRYEAILLGTTAPQHAMVLQEVA